MRRILTSLAALVALVTVGLVAAPATVSGAAASATIYDSTLSPLPSNQASQAFQTWQVSQVGNQVAFSSGSPRLLDDVVVTMSSWACETMVAGICTLVTPGASFNHPLTLNLYNVGAGNTVGSLIKTVTQTFAIPYRPTSDPGGLNCGGDTTAWYDAAENICDHGIGTNVTFNFGHTTLPDKVIYGVVSNTSGYGPTPYGYSNPCNSTPQGCGYDGLNVSLSTEPPSPGIGSDPVQNALYDSSSYAPFYCDGGSAGVGVFRLDQGCWGVNPPYTSAPYYIPSVRFDAVASAAPSITSASTASGTVGTPLNFTVATTGLPIPTLVHTGKLPAGATFTDNGNGTATIGGTPTANGTYKLKVHATSTTGRAIQNLTLVINQAPAFTTAATKTVKHGHAVVINVKTTGYPHPAITQVGLPGGLTLTDNGNGTAKVTGTAPAAGPYPFTLTATNGSGVANQAFTLTSS